MVKVFVDRLGLPALDSAPLRPELTGFGRPELRYSLQGAQQFRVVPNGASRPRGCPTKWGSESNSIQGTKQQSARLSTLNPAWLKPRAVSATTVKLARLSDAAIKDYIASGEWQGKAGGYGIQGYAARHVAWIQGSYTGVVGLPLFETSQLLAGLGYPITAPISAEQ